MSLGDELVNETEGIVELWYKAWKQSRHPHPELSEAALKDLLPSQLELIGRQIQKLDQAESPQELWLNTRRLDPEERVVQKVPIEEVVQEYRIAVETIRDWIEDRKIQVTFKEYSYFSSSIFELIAEAVRRYSKFQAEQIANERSEYLAGLTHQMRNPISAMSMQLDFLAKKDGSKALSQLLPMLQRNLKRLRMFIEGIMRIERFKPEEIPVYPETIQLSALIRRLVEDYRGDAAQRGLRLETEVNHGHRIQADPELIFDALGNILQNALKYTSSGFVRIEVQEENQSFLFKVIDSGPGISAERQKSLFKLIHPQKPGGVGIGLAVALREVKAQGGEIGVQSQLGHGSVFWFRIPKQVKKRDSLDSQKQASAA